MNHHTMHLAKSGKVTMEASRLSTICIEIYKSLKSINSSFMNEICKSGVTNRAARSQYKLYLDIPKFSHVTCGNNSIGSFELKIWNSLPLHIKPYETLKTKS